jgi:hypothetical protein
MWIKPAEKPARRGRLYQMPVCPQFDALSASSGRWGQVRGWVLEPSACPQNHSIGVGDKSLTPTGNSSLSTKSSHPVREARDNMLAGLSEGKAGQVTTTDTNRLLESEDSLK